MVEVEALIEWVEGDRHGEVRARLTKNGIIYFERE